MRLPQIRLLSRTLLTFVCIAIGVVESFAQPNASLPNVLLIVSDDQRPDTIAALGNDIIETPHLDRLVHRGTTFTNAVCANPICTPSRAELLTGCTGLRNGVFDFGRTIDAALPTLPEPFQRAGYTTWYSGKWHNDGRPATHGYQRTNRLFTGGGGKWWKPQVDYRGQEVTGYKGWIFRDSEDHPLPELGVGLTAQISEVIADAAIEVVQQSDRPFFLHLNFTAPHDPLLLPAQWKDRYRADEMPLPGNFLPEHPFDHGNAGGRDENLLPLPRTEQVVRADLAAYYAVISHMDEQIGRILEAIDRTGQTESTIIVFCSDHGLAMGSHGLRGKQNMYEHTIGVPLIFAGPGVPQEQRVKGDAYLRDIFPTLCEMVGIEIPAVDGRSQLPVIRGEKSSVYEFVVGYFRDSQRMIRRDHWKLIEYPLDGKSQLFNLETDPLEQNNRAGDADQAERVGMLSTRLSQWLEEQEK